MYPPSRLTPQSGKSQAWYLQFSVWVKVMPNWIWEIKKNQLVKVTFIILTHLLFLTKNFNAKEWRGETYQLKLGDVFLPPEFPSKRWNSWQAIIQIHNYMDQAIQRATKVCWKKNISRHYNAHIDFE